MAVKFPRWEQAEPATVGKEQAAKKKRAELRLEAARKRERDALILNEMMAVTKFFYLPDDRSMLEMGELSAGKSTLALALFRLVGLQRPHETTGKAPLNVFKDTRDVAPYLAASPSAEDGKMILWVDGQSTPQYPWPTLQPKPPPCARGWASPCG